MVTHLPEITLSHQTVTAAEDAVRHVSYPTVTAFARAVAGPVRFHAFDVLTPLLVAHLEHMEPVKGAFPHVYSHQRLQLP